MQRPMRAVAAFFGEHITLWFFARFPFLILALVVVDRLACDGQVERSTLSDIGTTAAQHWTKEQVFGVNSTQQANLSVFSLSHTSPSVLCHSTERGIDERSRGGRE